MTGSPEFDFTAACCRQSFSGASAVVNLPLRRQLDWDRIVRLAHFHRVEGLVWHSLSARNCRIPGLTRSALSKAALAIAADNLHAARASRNLADAFNAAKLPLLFLKGLTLGALAYGNPAIKSAIDIDLLIDPVDLGTAAELLRDGGYHSVAPPESRGDQALHGWHRGWKESVWVRSSPRLQIDLHTRTADNPRLIPRINVHSPSQAVRIADGIELPTFARDELFAYLAVHGASSAWFRLKWISDFAALVHGVGEHELERLYHRSQELGAGRAAGQALLLAGQLFGTLADVPNLRAELTNDALTRRLHRAASRLLMESREPTARRGGTFPIHWTQMLLLPGAGYPLSELARQARKLLGPAAP